MPPYPRDTRARARFVIDRREIRPVHDSWRHQGVIVEDERSADGRPARTATVLLTGRECPWRCVMCDLWRYTTPQDTPRGAIPSQVAAVREELRSRSETVTQLKLYNASSFFDPRAVPDDDYGPIAEALHGVERVVVESHPSLVGSRVDRLLDALNGRAHGGRTTRLEVAMGLETAHPDALGRLNKRMTVDDFILATGKLRRRGVDVRTFLLIHPPFVPAAEQHLWLRQSILAAFSAGASVVSLIPTRPGNGAMEALQAEGLFQPPQLEDIERSLEIAADMVSNGRRIFVDLWDLERFSRCPHCFHARRDRMHAFNLDQRLRDMASCKLCGIGAAS